MEQLENGTYLARMYHKNIKFEFPEHTGSIYAYTFTLISNGITINKITGKSLFMYDAVFHPENIMQNINTLRVPFVTNIGYEGQRYSCEVLYNTGTRIDATGYYKLHSTLTDDIIDIIINKIYNYIDDRIIFICQEKYCNNLCNLDESMLRVPSYMFFHNYAHRISKNEMSIFISSDKLTDNHGIIFAVYCNGVIVECQYNYKLYIDNKIVNCGSHNCAIIHNKVSQGLQLPRNKIPVGAIFIDNDSQIQNKHNSGHLDIDFTTPVNGNDLYMLFINRMLNNIKK